MSPTAIFFYLFAPPSYLILSIPVCPPPFASSQNSFALYLSFSLSSQVFIPRQHFKYFFTSEEISFLPGLVILFISRLYFLRMATIDPIRFCDNVTVPLFIIELH